MWTTVGVGVVGALPAGAAGPHVGDQGGREGGRMQDLMWVAGCGAWGCASGARGTCGCRGMGARQWN